MAYVNFGGKFTAHVLCVFAKGTLGLVGRLAILGLHDLLHQHHKKCSESLFITCKACFAKIVCQINATAIRECM